MVTTSIVHLDTLAPVRAEPLLAPSAKGRCGTGNDGLGVGVGGGGGVPGPQPPVGRGSGGCGASAFPAKEERAGSESPHSPRVLLPWGHR